MAKKLVEQEFNHDRDDTTGTFRLMFDEQANLNAIANKKARASLRGTPFKIVIATRDIERAQILKQMLTDRGVSESISIATTAVSAVDTIRERQPHLVVVEPELADVMREVGGCRVLVLNGHDEETAAEVEKEV